MRKWSITAFFPEVKPAHLAHQSIVISPRTDTLRHAVAAALAEFRRRDGIRGKKLTTAQITVVVCGKEAK